jgi:radical SAM protein with 4Fe4S-binding SPASM domain
MKKTTLKTIKTYKAIIKGLFLFGFKKPLIPSAPYYVVWETTHNCNLKCRHCSASAGKKLENELSTEEALNAIDKLADFGVISVAFSGGEPLLRKDIFELTKYATDKGLYVSIDTNGTLITKEKAEQMKKAGIQYVRISLDSNSKETHDSFRGVPGSFDKTINGIKNVVGDFYVSTCTTINKFNYKEYQNIIDLSESLGVRFILFDEFIPIGRGMKNANMDLSAEEREQFLKDLYNKMLKTRTDIIAAFTEITRIGKQVDGCKYITPTYNANFKGLTRRFFSKYIGGCSVGRGVILIKPNGDINPCSFLPIKIGNIRTDNLKEIWRNNKVLKDLRNKKNLKPKCGNCKYVNICGGCRARAYAYFGDYLGPDIGCIYNKEFSYNFQQNKY